MPFKSDRDLYLNADKTEVVEEGDSNAAFLLVGAGSEIDDADAAKYGLKSSSKTEDKAVAAPAEDKADDLDLSSFTKDELLAEAERRGVEVAKSSKKDDIIAALGG